MRKGITVILAAAGVILAISGIITKVKETVAISIIGGADGPTSVFLAGKLGSGFSIGAIAAGIVFLVLAVLLIRRK